MRAGFLLEGDSEVKSCSGWLAELRLTRGFFSSVKGFQQRLRQGAPLGARGILDSWGHTLHPGQRTALAYYTGDSG